MYQAEPDPYCYQGSEVLKNKAGLKTQEELDAFEAAMTFARSEEPLPRGRFSANHYCSVHRHLFQDVYSWAGKLRTVRLSKDTSTFCYPENIAHELRLLFGWLKSHQFLREKTEADFGKGAAHFLAELNAIHAFREGNGRTQLTFLALLADRAGHTLDFDQLDPPAMLNAMIQSFKGNERPLALVIRKLIS